MEKFGIIKVLGEGASGIVWQAINKQTNEMVAIKKMKRKYNYSLEQCLSLQEVNVLRNLKHPNIIKLKGVIKENDIIYLVFEYMVMEKRGKPFSEVEVRYCCFQIFQASAYMHQRGYFHRDLKPDNILVKRNTLKIADYGFARESSSRLPLKTSVGTLWYRAPEILLHSSAYDSAVDMWAMGATMLELFTLRPSFAGSSAADVIYQMCTVLGPPNSICWPEGLPLAEAIDFQFPKVAANHSISMQIPTASSDAVNLISSLCSWDPRKRPTAAEVLQHSFFQPCICIPPSRRLLLEAVKKPAVGIIGDSIKKNATRQPLGDLSNTMVVANNAYSLFGCPLGMHLQQRKQPDVIQLYEKESLVEDDKKSHFIYQPIPAHIRGLLDPQRKNHVYEGFLHIYRA